MNTHFSVRSQQNQTFKIHEFSCLEEDNSYLILGLRYLISSRKYVRLESHVTIIQALPLGLDLRYSLLFSSMLIQQFVIPD